MKPGGGEGRDSRVALQFRARREGRGRGRKRGRERPHAIPGLEWEFGKVRSSSSSAALYNNSGREEAGNECARDARNGNESAHGREQPCPANI